MALLAIVGLAVALTAVARAHTLAARAQTAADASALAALDGAEATMIDSIRHTPYPATAATSASGSAECGSTARDAALEYAVANDAALDRCTTDGVRATVAVRSIGTVGASADDDGDTADDDTADDDAASGVERSATAELSMVWKIGDRAQTPPPDPLPTVAFLENEARRNGMELMPESGLLRLDPCGAEGLPVGGGVAVGVRAALRAAEQTLGEPVGFRTGWTEPCEPPPVVDGQPILFDQRSLLRVESPSALVSVLGPEVPLCQPYPGHPDHFALAREPVCGGRAGVLTSAFPNLDRLIEFKRILVD